MSTTKKAAPSTCTGGDGNGQQLRLGGFGNLSGSNCITAVYPKQDSVAAVLSKDRGHAFTMCKNFIISSFNTREVTRAICDERQHIAPILSDLPVTDVQSHLVGRGYGALQSCLLAEARLCIMAGLGGRKQ